MPDVVIAYADHEDCRAMKGFPTATQVSDDQLDEWCGDISGELDLVFLKGGVASDKLPVTGPPALLSHLKTAVIWGVAARMESAPLLAQPGTAAAGMNVYDTVFVRMKRELEELTEQQYVRLGLIPGLVPTENIPALIGLSLVGNDSIIETDPYAWMNEYPFVAPPPGQG